MVQINMYLCCSSYSREGWLSLAVSFGTTYLLSSFSFIQAGVSLRIFQLMTWKKPETLAATLDCQTSKHH